LGSSQNFLEKPAIVCKWELISDSKLGLIIWPLWLILNVFNWFMTKNGVWTPFLINVNFGKFAVFDLCRVWNLDNPFTELGRYKKPKLCIAKKSNNGGQKVRHKCIQKFKKSFR
jgi:hypothetical protein